MNQYFVYILLCSDNSYYTGITNDLEKRLYEHENGIDPKSYTFKRRPLKLAFHERFAHPTQAIAFEKQIKGWNRAKKEAIINGNWHLLPELSLKKSDVEFGVEAERACFECLSMTSALFFFLLYDKKMMLA